jgi:hypothetical protein
VPDVPHPWPEATIKIIEEHVEANKEDSQFIRWWDYEFPVKNPVKMTATQNGQEIELATFMYPSQKAHDSGEYKGIVFFVHGFADYSER